MLSSGETHLAYASGDLKIDAFHLYFERFPALVLQRVAVGARGARAVSQGKAQDAPFLYGPTWLLLKPQRHGMHRPVLCSMLGGAYRVVKPRAPTSAATSGLRADRRFRLGARFLLPKMHQRRAPFNNETRRRPRKINRSAEGYSPSSGKRIMVASRPGPTPIEEIRQPTSSSRRRMYACAASGSSSKLRHPVTSSLQPGTIS